jgi:hypothetical protein
MLYSTQIWGKQLLDFTSRRIRFEKRISCIARTQHIGFCSVSKGLLVSSSEPLPFHGLGAAPPDLISYLPKASNRSTSTHGAAAGIQDFDRAVRSGLRKQNGIPWHDHRRWSRSSKALQREDFVRIVLAGQYSPASCRSSPSAIWLVAELLVQKVSTLFFSVRCSGAINHSQ